MAEDTDSNSDSVLRSLKILSYNVWFREDLEMDKRMQALGDLIQRHSPDVICLQVSPSPSPSLVPFSCLSYGIFLFNRLLDLSWALMFLCRKLLQISMMFFSSLAGGRYINARFRRRWHI